MYVSTVTVRDTHFIGWVAGITSTTHQRQQVAAEQHLHNAYASVAEDSPERFSERIDIVDAESVVRPASETAWNNVYAEIERTPGGEGEGGSGKGVSPREYKYIMIVLARVTNECRHHE